MIITVRQNLQYSSEKAVNQFVEQAVGKPFIGQDVKQLGIVVKATRVDDSNIVDLEIDTEVCNMKKLFARLQTIVDKKTRELRKLEETSPELIDCPILECEINDAQYMIIIIHADMPHDHKLSGIKALYSQTTSGSIYEAVSKFFEEEGVQC
jgi:hypothetical protein